MKKTILLMGIILLASCSSNSESNTQGGTSNSNPSFNYAWKDEVTLLMENALGESIPHLPSFGNLYQYETGMMAASSIPYVNPYWQGSLAQDFTQEYSRALETATYLFINEDTDEDDAACVWKNYAKPTSVGDLYVRFSYYHSLVNGQTTPYFEIYAWLENDGGGGLVMPDTVDFAFDALSFGANNTNYDNSNKEFDVLNASVKADYIMNANNQIQMKKAGARLYNVTALAPIKFILLNGLSYYGLSTNVELLAGMSPESLQVVSTYNDIYNLNGATFFEIRTNNRQVVHLDYIEFLLVR